MRTGAVRESGMRSERANYYSERNEVAEAEIAEALESAWNVKLHKTWQYRRYDYLANRGTKVVGFVEMKDRDKSSTKFPTFMLGIDKWAYLLNMSDTLRTPSVLVIRFTDGIHYCHAKPGDFLIEYNPNWVQYRGDEKDIEAAIHIPMSMFRPLRGPK